MSVERSEKFAVVTIGTTGEEFAAGDVEGAAAVTATVGRATVVVGVAPRLFFRDSTASCCMYICINAGFCRLKKRLRRTPSEVEVTGGNGIGAVLRIGVGGELFSSVRGDWVPRAAAASAAAPGRTGIIDSEMAC